MALTQIQISTAKPRETNYRLYDEKGLYLEIAKTGGKWWRFKYRVDSKEKKLALGVYPDVSLKEARVARDEARRLLAQEVDPSDHRKAAKTAKAERAKNSFEIIAREWFAIKNKQWVQSHALRIIQRLERDIFPWLGPKPIADIPSTTLLGVIRRIEERGSVETAHRAMNNCSQIFRYAVQTGRADRDITQDLRGALTSYKSNHFAAETNPQRFGQLLNTLEGYEGTLIVKCALRLAPLLFVRPGELRHAKWADIDFANAEWRYLITKTKTEHIVPLSTQALSI